MITSMSFRIDASGLASALVASSAYSNRTPALAANTAAYVVAKFAWSKTPTTTIARIDSELSVTVTPILSTRGPRKGLPLKSGKRLVAVPQMGLAAMIVLARMHPGSNYSMLTGNKWPVQIPDTHRRQAFWDAVQIIAQRMVGARHSSIKFLQSCWIPAIRELEKYTAPGTIRGRQAAIGPGRSQDFVPDSGSAVPANAGEIIAVAIISNDAGMAGDNSVLNAKHNEALWRYGGPALQEAIDDEAFNTMEYVNRKEWERAMKPLVPKGFLVDV